MLGLDAVTNGNLVGGRAYYLSGAELHTRLLDHEGSAYALSGLAGLALAQHRPEVSARLTGASRHALDVVGLAAWSGTQSMNDAQDAEVTADLGSRSFARICAEGAQMSLPEALSYAIAATALTPAGSD